ncbi:SDR family NAD(P)-dependent oxidoreductase [Streptomyces sp. NBC_01352]|uniref:SDR family NAD(P)-dependent oxidoreductase n=1 Tax=Streptomyces sp. NBC_01352 TaxID=2903834 RepID=UPI002E35946D|nr:SDR family NAD(P)-dependent oxidoreductase [Streptomyces sp. NBC_01352]
MPTLAIVGAGPNLGLATAARFGAEGFDVGLVARDHDKLRTMQDTLEKEGITTRSTATDITRPRAATTALTELAEHLGPIDVLLYSPLPSLDWIKPVTLTTSEDVRLSLDLSVLGAIDSVQAVLPAMRERGRGTLLFTTGGAAVAPSAARASSAVSYSAEVAYARLLHEELGPEGIRVAHTAIVGALGPGLQHEPAAVAGLLWRRHTEGGDFQTVKR